ncbi:MAG: RNA polymerase factor sigma-54 [Betaproteobacteria bacterium]
MSLTRESRQQHSLTPRLQRAVKLLQLSSLDFAQELQSTLASNPFLENADTDAEEDADGLAPPNGADASESPDAVASAPNDAQPDAESVRAENEAEQREFDDSPHEAEIWPMEESRAGPRDDGRDFNHAESMPHETTLQEYLRGQLNVLSLPDRDLVLANAIVESLDDDGFLRTDLDELVDLVEFDPPASAGELRIALKRVQALEPAGVAARSVKECLLLQLAPLDCPIRGELARKIVSEHLDRLAARDIAGLVRALGRNRDDVELACASIRQLQPRPGWKHDTMASRFITPDVIVRKFRGVWTASLNPAVVPKVRINGICAELFQRHRGAQHSELAAHLQEARWMMRTVEQRFSTILSVAEAILRRQSQFLEYGALAMKPLGLSEIAAELQLHESTVSRVTNNKYMATPIGIFELKYFFSRGMKTANGGKCSPTAIRGLVKDMIEGERATERLSDAEIARQLARQGLVVARRTVTKYRQSLRLETADLRGAR